MQITEREPTWSQVMKVLQDIKANRQVKMFQMLSGQIKANTVQYKMISETKEWFVDVELIHTSQFNGRHPYEKHENEDTEVFISFLNNNEQKNHALNFIFDDADSEDAMRYEITFNEPEKASFTVRLRNKYYIRKEKDNETD